MTGFNSKQQMAADKLQEREALAQPWPDLTKRDRESYQKGHNDGVAHHKQSVKAAQPAQEAHSDDEAVNRFAAAMKAKLAEARAKGRSGWEACPPEALSRMLREHVEKGDPRDVANFCTMLWALGAGITAQPKQEPQALQGLAAYLRCEAGGELIGSPNHETLMQWAREVDAARAQPPLPPQRQPLTDEQKDAARWRFLIDNSFDKGVTQFHVWEHSWEPHSQTGEPTEWKQRVRGPALDRFIDRAIEAAHNIGAKP